LNKSTRITLVSMLIIFVFINAAGIFMISGEKIQPNTYINNIDVGKLGKDEALVKIRGILEPSIENVYIPLKVGEKVWKLNYSDFDYTYDYINAIEEAYHIGRGSNFLFNIKDVIVSRINQTNIKMSFSYQANYINTLLSTIAKEVNQEAMDATIKMKGKAFIITDEKLGKELDQKKSYDLIIESIKNSKISLINLPLQTTEPEIKRSDLAVIKDKLGEYTTRFNANDSDRSYNILLATKSVANVLVKPSQVFSLNKTIGPRLEKFGFKTAKVIINNELVPGIGGGVCQVSSTLYNAALLSDLKIVERRNHSLPSSYISLGRDATISGDYIDLKFQNITKYPIYIYGELKGGTVTFSIYGKSDGPVKNVKIETEVISKKQPEMKIIEDNTLMKGLEIVEKKSQTGYVVKSYRVVYENGKEIKRESLYTDTYRSSNGVKRVGTMKPIEQELLLEY